MKNEMASLLLDERICFIRLPPDTLQNFWQFITCINGPLRPKAKGRFFHECPSPRGHGQPPTHREGWMISDQEIIFC
jgi:hypothetical protein